MSSVATPAWQRWLLLSALLLVGVGYIAAFLFFRTHSEDFVAARINAPAAGYAAEHPAAPGTSIAFGADRAESRQLGAGWHVPEKSGGVWSNHETAWLFVRVPAGDAPVALAFDADVFVSPSHPRVDVTLYSNDVEIARWQLDEQTFGLHGDIPLPAEQSNGDVAALRFKIDSPASPWRERAGDDTRMLGILLRSIRVVRSAPSRD